jgi:hypothetical protein
MVRTIDRAVSSIPVLEFEPASAERTNRVQRLRPIVTHWPELQLGRHVTDGQQSAGLIG